MFDSLPELMIDLFGNYLCQVRCQLKYCSDNADSAPQKLVESATEPQRFQILTKLAPHLTQISCDRQGTRAVQKIIEVSQSSREVCSSVCF